MGFAGMVYTSNTILLNAQPSGARAKIVPILDRFCVIAAGCTA